MGIGAVLRRCPARSGDRAARAAGAQPASTLGPSWPPCGVRSPLASPSSRARGRARLRGMRSRRLERGDPRARRRARPSASSPSSRGRSQRPRRRSPCVCRRPRRSRRRSCPPAHSHGRSGPTRSSGFLPYWEVGSFTPDYRDSDDAHLLRGEPGAGGSIARERRGLVGAYEPSSCPGRPPSACRWRPGAAHDLLRERLRPPLGRGVPLHSGASARPADGTTAPSRRLRRGRSRPRRPQLGRPHRLRALRRLVLERSQVTRSHVVDHVEHVPDVGVRSGRVL